ncbi:homoserine O-succinyltransferase [Salinicoccus sp. CNSTN-B1]
MPIKIIEGLPVKEHLHNENVYTIEEHRAYTQDIRPLRILILNLMPKKEETELQLLRLLGNTPLQVDVDFMHMNSHISKNTPTSHLQKYYHTFREITDRRYDGMIVTGAPVEKLDFHEVDYIDELRNIMKWSETHVFSRFFICWGAQFALNHYFGIRKFLLSDKLFGVFDYDNIKPYHPLLRGFDDVYRVPQSRHAQIDCRAVQHTEGLEVLTRHDRFGPDIMCTDDQRDLFVLGHLEYGRTTLEKEYERDLRTGGKILPPSNYFIEDDSDSRPVFSWKSHAHLLFNNWINETYQNTYYDLTQLEE